MGYNEVNPLRDFIINAGGRAGCQLLCCVFQVFAENDFDEPPNDGKFLLRKPLRNERSQVRPGVFGWGAGRDWQEGAFAIERVTQMIQRGLIEPRRQWRSGRARTRLD